MANDSRITGGGIELLVDPKTVERVGFCTIYELRDSVIKKRSFMRPMNPKGEETYAQYFIGLEQGRGLREQEKRKLDGQKIPPSLQTLSKFLLEEDLYLTRSNLSFSITTQQNPKGFPIHRYDGIPMYIIGTGDVYQLRDDETSWARDVEIPELMPINLH